MREVSESDRVSERERERERETFDAADPDAAIFDNTERAPALLISISIDQVCRVRGAEGCADGARRFL